MLDRTGFVAAFPEFADADTAVIDAALAEAAISIDTTVWGKFENSGHGRLTAHLLTYSVLGNAAKLKDPKPGQPRTTHEAEYMRLRAIAGGGLRST